MENFTNKPCAAKGLLSYRYQGPLGVIMISAHNTDDALKQADRSLTSTKASVHNLEVWNGTKYVSVA